MEISGILTVDGYIKANSYDTTSTVYNGASGGSGGSIEINTGNFSGEFLAFIPFEFSTSMLSYTEIRKNS